MRGEGDSGRCALRASLRAFSRAEAPAARFIDAGTEVPAYPMKGGSAARVNAGPFDLASLTISTLPENRWSRLLIVRPLLAGLIERDRLKELNPGATRDP